MTEFKDIKFKGQIENYSTLKAGLKLSDLDGDLKLQSIFNAIDTANKDGVKDGVLDENEIKTFMQKIVEFAKGGRDKNLSSKEANKLLQSLGLTNLTDTDLFTLLNSFSTQSKNIKQTTKNNQNSSNVIEYTDGHTEEIFQDGSKILTIKNGNKITVSREDKDGTTVSKTETTIENGVETVIEYEGKTPKSKTVTDLNNNTISKFTLENGKEVLIQEENTHTGDVITFKDGTRTTTKKDGTVIVEKDGQTTITSSDKNITTVNSESGTVTTVKNPEDKSETVTTTDNNETTTILNKKDGKNISQTITKEGQSYTVEYDGNGNTKGVVVQNGESPAVIAKKFGCKLEDLIAANPEAIKGKAPNQYFLVGADIVIPGEMDAENFAKLNAGRQTKEQAVGKYTQFVQTQQAQIETEDAELVARKNHKRTFLEQKWNTFEECAIAYYKREGVTNPTKRQIELRVKELQELNPNLKDGEIKGKKIIATFSPETDTQIGAGQQRREIAQMEEKRKAETVAGKNMAQVMYNAIDDHVGGVSERDFQANLKKVNADNVVGLLKQYNEISPDETLIEAIMDETWNSLDTRRGAINKIVNALIQRAENANVSDERQKQAIEACKQELNSYWSLGIGYCQTSKLDGLINNLIGTIDAAEALTNEEKNQINESGINETLDLMNTQVTENTSALNAQLAEDGWCADLYEGLKWCVGSDNLDEHVKADLKKYEGYIVELQKAEQTDGEAGFKVKFKEIFGVDYDPKLMKGYNKLQSNFAMAQGLTMQKEGFYSEFGSCISGQEDYSSMRAKYGQYLVQLAQAEGENIDANSAVDTVIETQLQKEGLDINTATDEQKHQALQTVISNTYDAIDAELNKYTQGRSLANMEKELKNTGSAVFGNKNDIAFRVNDYISSQQQGGAAVNMAVKAVGAIAVGIATGGAGFAALATASLATAAISASVDLTDRVSSEVGLKEGEITNILKNATIDGASVFAGGMVGKYAAMFKNANAFVQAGGKLSMMMTGDIATGAAAEYLQTGTITLEGVAFQAVFSAAGNLVSLKQLAKTDVPTTTTGEPQQVRVSKGVKGDVNNHRDIIADGEVARNADQTHLNANERRIVEEGLEDVPTADELAKYQRENGYEPVPDTDKPAYQSHQEQVAADYADAHRVENNGIITEQKAPTVSKETIDKLNDEIRGIDGSIKRLEQQIAGAKRFGKNTEALEKQLFGLQQKRATKMAEIEAIQKPKAEVVSDNADVEHPKQTVETPEAKPSAEAKQDVTPESVRQSADNISDAEIPVEHKELWNDCKNRINSITEKLKNFKGDIDAMLLKCENLFADLKIIASKATASVKNKIEQLIEDLRSMLTPKNLPNVDEALTPSVTSQHRMEMGQIGQNINQAKSIDELLDAQTWLNKMPECSLKEHLQKQLDEKYFQISSAEPASSSQKTSDTPSNKPVQKSTPDQKLDWDMDMNGFKRNPNAKTNIENIQPNEVSVGCTFTGYSCFTKGSDAFKDLDSDFRNGILNKNTKEYSVYNSEKNVTAIGTKIKDSFRRPGIFNILVKGQVSEADAKALIEHLKKKNLIPESTDKMDARELFVLSEKVQTETANYFNNLKQKTIADTPIVKPEPENSNAKLGSNSAEIEQLRVLARNDKLKVLESNYPTMQNRMQINGKTMDVTIYRGSQQGSNPGFWVKDNSTGELYYYKQNSRNPMKLNNLEILKNLEEAGFLTPEKVRKYSKKPDILNIERTQARNASEVLAAELYDLAGINGPELSVVRGNNNECIGVMSKFNNYTGKPSNDALSSIREGFAADCWLANWDALKDGNILMSNGEAVRADVGGSLCFRAKGGRKTTFRENVDELTSFFGQNSLSKKYLDGMSHEELLNSLSHVTGISDEQINDLVDKFTGTKTNRPSFDDGTGVIGYTYSGGIQNPQYLKETLITRRDYMARFEAICKENPMKPGETIADYMTRIADMTPKTKYSLNFDSEHMNISERVQSSQGLENYGQTTETGHKLGEHLTPSQKRLLDNSYNAYKTSQSKRYQFNDATSQLTTNHMVHSTTPEYLERILSDGLLSREFHGNSTAGYGNTGIKPGTRTPMCADVFDIQQNSDIYNYLRTRKYANGEGHFIYKESPLIIFNKNAVDPRIMNNSFMVSKANSNVLHQDGNMSGYTTYTSHRGVPVGIPANAIEKIVLPAGTDISRYKKIIIDNKLTAKIFDNNGRLLFDPS